MGWIRRNKGQAIASLAIGLGLLAVVLAFVVGGSNDDPGPLTAPGTTIGGPRVDPTPGVYAGPTPDPTPAASVGDRVADATSGKGGGGMGLGSGLAGGGGTKNLPKRHITMSMRSSAPIGVVGYVVPTSLDNAYGVVKNVGTSWSISTIGYGNPDYAQLFAQSGPTGAVVTCTITVDGVVTESRSTDGPYSQLFCQG